MNSVYYFKKSVSEPELIPSFVKQKYSEIDGEIRSAVLDRRLVSQKKLLQDLLEEDSFALIILDACRFDRFQENYSGYVNGDLKPVYSGGRLTFEYVRECFPDYYEVDYISGAIPVNGTDLEFDDEEVQDLYQDYRPKNHFKQIVDVWKTGWDEELGTVPAEQVTKAAIQNMDKDRMVIHYFQPHAPYIGERSEVLDGRTQPGKGEPGDKQVWERVRSGEISRRELQVLYEDNLRLVLSEVERLLPFLEDKDRVVVTSDHGEMLGEYGLFGHHFIEHPKIREVPWLEIVEKGDSH